MGDIVSLVERAQEVFDEKSAKEFEEKMSKAEFSFNDFLKMQNQMKMFGSFDQLLGMLPGVNISKDDKQMISRESEKQFKRIDVFISSMTPDEREHPERSEERQGQGQSRGRTHTRQALHHPDRLCPHSGRAGECPAFGAGFLQGPADRGFRLRWRPGSHQAAHHGQTWRGAFRYCSDHIR